MIERRRLHTTLHNGPCGALFTDSLCAWAALKQDPLFPVVCASQIPPPNRSSGKIAYKCVGVRVFVVVVADESLLDH